MKLSILNPVFVYNGGDGVRDAMGRSVPKRERVGITFACPSACGQDIVLPFEKPPDGGPCVVPGGGWKREGEALDSITLTPSILHNCGWHGWVKKGEITSL